MEIEKTLTLAAPPTRVWAMLLDPQLMSACVPGMQSVEVLSPTEYTALIQVKIAFISARFKLRTSIVEQRAPEYLRTEGSGEDTSVASALKQTSELFLTDLGNGQTELRTRVLVDVTGRLGTFGLSVMKTKADRMWEEFCGNLVQRIAQVGEAPGAVEVLSADLPVEAPTIETAHGPAALAAARATATPSRTAVSPAMSTPSGVPQPAMARISSQTPSRETVHRSWWARLLARVGGDANRNPPVLSPHHVHVEVRTGTSVITVDWPVQSSADCLAWLREVTSV